MSKKKTTPPAGNDNQAGASSKSEAITSALQKIGGEVLSRNPELQAVYATADGNVFANDCDAANHAKTLKNKEVLTIKK